ncbi:tellurite resistance/C4-dicarboxylate transporter family protein [Gracilibacillus ureilyticus]|uniref:tellurite resistance/C4-dicarboxylate transporter family protein n=1 Tax=Gracilibacillus ureilyticus TaxID=531814 RepID=UPI000B7EF353|nr:tellurite resistance/C4-dicarboxylate transporter family protein [Gracilibacillus ureilyticus]
MLVILDKIKKMFTGYFALVMATGALSVATNLLGYQMVSEVLLIVNTVFYIILAILVVIRVIFYFPYVKNDLTSHLHGPGFFTLVAGTNVYGVQLIVISGSYNISVNLWIISMVLWVIIMYSFFTAVTIRENKPSLVEGINGAWLIAAVATQSISVLGTLVADSGVSSQISEWIFFISISMYLLGGMLYLSIITLIFYRFTFLNFKHASLTPPYWINMGAVAITALAGSMIVLHSDTSQLIQQFLPFVKGFTLFFWVTGTWWIPLLVILMVWRYIIKKYPINYDQQMWGMVFPLAMYTTATYQLSEALGISFLAQVSHVFVYPAIITWVLGVILLLFHLVRDVIIKKENNA